MKNVIIPMTSVMTPLRERRLSYDVRAGKTLTYSTKNSHRHPALSSTPRMCSTPNAMKLATMLQMLDDIQKNASRNGSSVLV